MSSTVTKMLGSKNKEHKSKQKYFSVRGNLKEKHKFWQNTKKANENIR